MAAEAADKQNVRTAGVERGGGGGSSEASGERGRAHEKGSGKPATRPPFSIAKPSQELSEEPLSGEVSRQAHDE